jgi:hypothetical protein
MPGFCGRTRSPADCHARLATGEANCAGDEFPLQQVTLWSFAHSVEVELIVALASGEGWVPTWLTEAEAEPIHVCSNHWPGPRAITFWVLAAWASSWKVAAAVAAGQNVGVSGTRPNTRAAVAAATAQTGTSTRTVGSGDRRLRYLTPVAMGAGGSSEAARRDQTYSAASSSADISVLG